MRSSPAEAFRGWRAACLVALLVTGCLPPLEDACVVDEECPTDRRCVGGVCAPRGGDLGLGDLGPDGAEPVPDVGRPDVSMPDALPLDAAVLDAAPVDVGADAILPDAAPEDVGLPDEGAPDMAVVDLGPDGGCMPVRAACNGQDDNCNGVIDEVIEAVEGCPGVRGAQAACQDQACVYACEMGAEPIRDDDPALGCRRRRTCALDGDGWVAIAQGFEKGKDDAQQVTIAADGDRRFVAAYDLRAVDANRIVRSFEFMADAPDEAVEQRIGDPRNEHRGVLVGLTSVAVGQRFVAAAWRLVDGDADDQIQLMARDDQGSPQRDFWMDWPQPPALATLPGDAPAVVAIVESHIDRDDPPLGNLMVYRWDPADGAAEERPALRPGPARPTGAAYDTALTLPGGQVAFLADVVDEDQGGAPLFGLRVERFDAELATVGSFTAAVDGPIVDRVSWARAQTGFVVFTAVDEVEQLQWRTLRRDGTAFAGAPVTVPWADPPKHAQALALLGGVGVIYDDSEHVFLVLPDPEEPDFGFEGQLPGSQNKVRAVAAYQPNLATVEVVLLRDGGAMVDGQILFGRYVCY